jgi:mannose-6-phosphate isomerase-like protein (cupin superfamily)
MIVRPDQAHIYSMGRGEARILVDAECSGGTWWLGQFREDPGYTTGLHFHHLTDEQFFVLDGVLSVYVDGTWHDLEPGTFAVVPHATPHAQANAGKQPVHFLGSGSPCGFERFFPELHQLTTRLSPQDPQFGAEVSKIVSRHDTQIIGPPPPRTQPA